MIVSTKEGTLSRETVKEWCVQYHYARRVPQISNAFGWVGEDGELQAILVIGKPASNALCEGVCGKENKGFVYELNRICAKPTLDVPLSSFVGEVLRSLGNMIVVSYADRGQNHNGTIYQALNFIYTGATRERTDIKTVGHSRHYQKADAYPERVFRSSKHRYILFVGEKRFKKALKRQLRYPTLPYPKENSQKYIIDWNSGSL